MLVTMYGVRGSCPCSGAHVQRIGGNTSCVLVSVPGEPPLVLDLGTGLRPLGEALAARHAADHTPLRLNALLTHLHFDHIIGLPFFGPLHDPTADITVYGPVQQGATLAETVAGAVRPPFFPVPMAEIGGRVEFAEVCDDDFVLGGITVRSRQVPHPGTTLGFRVEAAGRSLAYIPDHQAPADRRGVAASVLELCAGADLVVHDAQYSEEEFAGRSDWGHSTVAYAVRVAAESGAKRLLLFHHDPSHTDVDEESMLRAARELPDARRLTDVSLAVEGMTYELGA